MSIPPNNYPPNVPPGGYYPSQPPRRSGVSGWKIAGFGCLGLFLLAAVGGVLLVRSFKNNLAHPSKNSIIGIGVLAGKAGIDGQQISQAIVAYHDQYGKYPKSLMTLYNDRDIDGKLLHNDLDNSPDPAHVSWKYMPPAESAPGNTPILEEPYTITFGGTTQPGKVVVDLDGKTESNANSQTNSMNN